MRYVLIVIGLLISAFWGYLFFTTHPVIIFDAISYEQSGRDILAKGWLDCLRQGPAREPIFPLLIALTMRLEQMTGASYQYFLKFFLMLSLAGTMALVYRLARCGGAGRGWAAAGAFYLGISPALVNSMLWLWSEAAVFPWPVLTVLSAAQLWRALNKHKTRAIVVWTGVLTLAVLLLVFLKAAALVVVPLFLLPLIVRSVFECAGRKFGRAVWSFGVALSVAGIFCAVTQGYMVLNQKLNGQRVFTDRGDWALFGNTIRRMQPLTRTRLAEAVLAAPRLGLCEKYYGADCGFWGYKLSDQIGMGTDAKLSAAHFSPEQKRKFYLQSSWQAVAAKPAQQVLLMAVEGSKMLYWENRPYFVTYPDWLTRINSNLTFGIWHCLTLAALSLAGAMAALWAGVWLFRLPPGCRTRSQVVARLWAVWFVFLFAGVHSLFFIDIRYAFPLGGLFVALIVTFASSARALKG